MGSEMCIRDRLLDEPSLGLAPMLVAEIFSIIRDINAEGTTLLLVEQNARKALSVADRAYVLETGNVIREGSGTSLLADPSVQEAYLGTRAATRRRRRNSARPDTEA